MDRKLLTATMALLFMVMLMRTGGAAQTVRLDVRSPVFDNGDRIPAKYTCDGEDVSPPVQWSKGPTATQSYALIVDDPDAQGGPFAHWVIYNIPYNVTRFEEYVTALDRLDDGTLQGKNHFGRIGYGGPCPPPNGPHHYHFKVYALDSRLNLGPGASRDDLLRAIQGHVLAQGELIGIYGR